MFRPILYRVKGNSMLPTLRLGDCLLTRPADPARPPPRGSIVAVAVCARAGERMLKRIVGLPGERIALEDGMLYINGRRYAEPYLRGMPSTLGLRPSTTTLGEDEYFVMGDNRPHSADSRHYGPITLPEIEAVALMRIWPPGRLGSIN